MQRVLIGFIAAMIMPFTVSSLSLGQETKNLIANPGFEEGAKGWNFYDHAEGLSKFAIAPEGRDGKNAAKLTMSGPPGTNGCLEQYFVRKDLAGKRYRLSLWAQCADAKIGYELACVNEKPSNAYYWIKPTEWRDGWAQYSVVFDSAKDVTAFSVCVYVRHAGALLVDDISLVEAPEAELTNPPQPKQAPGPVQPTQADLGGPLWVSDPSYVPSPFEPLRWKEKERQVDCLSRTYDFSAGVIPTCSSLGRPAVTATRFRLNGQALEKESNFQTSQTAAGVTRFTKVFGLADGKLQVDYHVDYDGFVTVDCRLVPSDNKKMLVEQFEGEILFDPAFSLFYHFPIYGPTTYAGFIKEISAPSPVPMAWVGNDEAGFAFCTSSYRNWKGPVPHVSIRKVDGRWSIKLSVISEKVELREPLAYRWGIIATPARPPEQKHLQLYLHNTYNRPVNQLDTFSDTVYGGETGYSEYYSTFRTNSPQATEAARGQVAAIHAANKKLMLYTTLMHIRSDLFDKGGGTETWVLHTPDGKRLAPSIGPGKENEQLFRLFTCPGSDDWVKWKTEDLEYAMREYHPDGFYVDTSSIQESCANSLHGHGWQDAGGGRHSDFLVWSLRGMYKRVYEMLARANGRARIYSHQSLCIPAVYGGFMEAYCDGEQYMSYSIRKNLTLDAFRAEFSGRNTGPLAIFLGEYHGALIYGFNKTSEHFSATEEPMLCLLHDILEQGGRTPGAHPEREVVQWRDDFGLTDAEWTPYWRNSDYPPDKADVKVSYYRNKLGDFCLIAGNPTYEPVSFSISRSAAPGNFYEIGVKDRMGKSALWTSGYWWKKADPQRLQLGPRDFAVYACIKDLGQYAGMKGREWRPEMQHPPLPRKTTVDGKECVLVDDAEEVNWELSSFSAGTLALSQQAPHEGSSCLEVKLRPGSAASLDIGFTDPQLDCRKYSSVGVWIRPAKEMDGFSLSVRLTNQFYEQPISKPEASNRTLAAAHWQMVTFPLLGERDKVSILTLSCPAGSEFCLDDVLFMP